jgi:hypothetical protein
MNITEREFLELLNSIEFPRLYWELCERFPVRPGGVANQGLKEEILAGFREMGIDPCCDSRTYTVEEERIGDLTWSGVFVKQRHGVELMIEGISETAVLGSNFAVLAYDAKKLADPSFERDRFSGPPPYPRPDHNGDPVALKAIVKEFVKLARLIKDKLRTQVGGTNG